MAPREIVGISCIFPDGHREVYPSWDEATAYWNKLPPRATAGEVISTYCQILWDEPQTSKWLQVVGILLSVAVLVIFAIVMFGVLLVAGGLAQLVKAAISIAQGAWQLFTSLKVLLQAFKFKELYDLHKIVYKVWPAYRTEVNKVYKKISEVSAALGFMPEFLGLALRNARNLVLGASNALGRDYDLAELDWWVRFDKWTVDTSDHLNRYKEDPELLFEDIDALLIEPASDSTSGVFSKVMEDVTTVATGLAVTVEEVHGVRNDLGQMISDLPADVQKYVRPVTDPILNKFDDFYYDTYTPAITALGIEIEESGKREAVLLERIEGIDLTIKTSTVRLKEWERLPPEERENEEDHQEEISTRRYRRQSEEYETVVIEEDERVEAIREERKIVVAPAPAPEVLTYEPERPALLPPKLRWWDVGDY